MRELGTVTKQPPHIKKDEIDNHVNALDAAAKKSDFSLVFEDCVRPTANILPPPTIEFGKESTIQSKGDFKITQEIYSPVEINV